LKLVGGPWAGIDSPTSDLLHLGFYSDVGRALARHKHYDKPEERRALARHKHYDKPEERRALARHKHYDNPEERRALA